MRARPDDRGLDLGPPADPPPAPPPDPLGATLGALRGCWIDVRCRCGTKYVPFRLVLAERPALGEAALAAYIARLRCPRCGEPGRVGALHARADHEGWKVPLGAGA